jgi:uncharacterized membrane protein
VEGFYLNTLCGVDVASGWTECLPVWGKGQLQVEQRSGHKIKDIYEIQRMYDHFKRDRLAGKFGYH